MTAVICKMLDRRIWGEVCLIIGHLACKVTRKGEKLMSFIRVEGLVLNLRHGNC